MPVRLRPTALLLAGALAAGAVPAACARQSRLNKGGPAEPQAATVLRVQNQNFLDMNIYVVRGGVRSRLGTATGNATVRLTIPPTFVQSLIPLRFQATPIGGRGAPVSEEITVSPGDEVTITIPPG